MDEILNHEDMKVMKTPNGATGLTMKDKSPLRPLKRFGPELMILLMLHQSLCDALNFL